MIPCTRGFSFLFARSDKAHWEENLLGKYKAITAEEGLNDLDISTSFFFCPSNDQLKNINLCLPPG